MPILYIIKSASIVQNRPNKKSHTICATTYYNLHNVAQCKFRCEINKHYFHKQTKLYPTCLIACCNLCEFSIWTRPKTLSFDSRYTISIMHANDNSCFRLHKSINSFLINLIRISFIFKIWNFSYQHLQFYKVQFHWKFCKQTELTFTSGYIEIK